MAANLSWPATQQMATKLQDTSLQSELQAIFDAKPPISRIFINYSHKDRHWVNA